MSTRTRREKKKRYDSDLTRVQQAHPNKWSVEDKKKLLLALRQYGHTDTKSIAAMMKNKSATSVKLIIHKIMQKAKANTSSLPCTTLETWINSGMFNDTSSPVAQAFKLISMFEKHPAPEESNGFDFCRAYEHLHRMLLGNPGLDISEETSSKLQSLMDEIEKEVWPAAEDDIVGYLGTLNRRKHALRRYPAMNKLESRRVIGPDQDCGENF